MGHVSVKIVDVPNVGNLKNSKNLQGDTGRSDENTVCPPWAADSQHDGIHKMHGELQKNKSQHIVMVARSDPAAIWGRV